VVQAFSFKQQSTSAQPFWALQSPLFLLFADGGLCYRFPHIETIEAGTGSTKLMCCITSDLAESQRALQFS